MGSSDPIAAEERLVEIEDKNGKIIALGDVVRVAIENMKAYQVPKKGFGSFNEDKEFVPAAGDAPRGTKNLVLPQGIRGVVTKIYDVDVVSANCPITVKFMPGKNTDEGFDPPNAFLMHFESHEIEIV
jgi:hypothetical protein